MTEPDLAPAAREIAARIASLLTDPAERYVILSRDEALLAQALLEGLAEVLDQERVR